MIAKTDRDFLKALDDQVTLEKRLRQLAIARMVSNFAILAGIAASFYMVTHSLPSNHHGLPVFKSSLTEITKPYFEAYTNLVLLGLILASLLAALIGNEIRNILIFKKLRDMRFND